MPQNRNSFLRIAGICSILAPLPLVAADIMKVADTMRFERTVVEWISFAFFIPAIFGLTYLVAAQGSRFVFVGGTIASLGAMAGSSMQVFARVRVILEDNGVGQVIQGLRASKKLIFATQTPGILFPLGLLLLAVALYRCRVVSRPIVFCLAAGAFFFPINHISSLMLGRVGADILLLIAFGAFGNRMLQQEPTDSGERYSVPEQALHANS